MLRSAILEPVQYRVPKEWPWDFKSDNKPDINVSKQVGVIPENMLPLNYLKDVVLQEH